MIGIIFAGLTLVKVHARYSIGSFLVLMVRKSRITQVELPLDSASGLVLQRAAAMELIDPRPLGSDQQQLDLVGKLGRHLMTARPIGAVFEMLESLLILSAKRLNGVRRQVALRG